MKRPSFREAGDLWERDGSLRDVYVREISESDWRALFDLAATYEYAYSVEGEKRDLPDASAILAGLNASHMLSIDVGGAQINCHFFVPDEIELDIDGRQIVDEVRHEQVLDFLEKLARALSKPLVIAAENAPDALYLSYSPRPGEWRVHSPFGGEHEV